MSTYIQGVSDTGFNPVQYTPNFPYMQQALQKAQAKYDTNYNQIASGYSAISDSLLLNPEDNIRRKEILDNAKDQLKQLSSKDLSIQTNVNDAEKIFAPFWEDQDLLADYKISKEYQNQRRVYEKLKNSDKKEDRDRAWDYGASYVELTAQDMALAKRGDGSIQSVKVRPYIPLINVSDEINKELKARGYDNKMIQSQQGNGYIYELINGEGTRQFYAKAVDEILNERPDLQDIFKVEGTVNFQSTVNKYRSQHPDISNEQAITDIKNQFASQKIDAYNKEIKKNNDIINNSATDPGLIANIKALEDKVFLERSKGIIGDDDPQFKELRTKKQHLADIQSMIAGYNSSIEGLKSDDFLRTSGEDYFTGVAKNDFVNGYALTRELAFSQKTTIDSVFVAAQKINEDRARDKTKYEQDRLLDLNNNGIIDEGDALLGNQKANAKSVETFNSQGEAISNDKTGKMIGVNIPTTGTVYPHSLALSTSYFDNLKSNYMKYGDGFIKSAFDIIQASPYVTTHVDGFNEYLDQLNAYLNPTKPVNQNLSDAKLKATFEILKQEKVFEGTGITKYTDNPTTQLTALVKFAENKHRENNKGILNDDIVKAHIQYENYSKLYNESKQVYNDFSDYYSKLPPTTKFSSVVIKNPDKTYRSLNPTDLVNASKKLSKYDEVVNGPNAQYNKTIPIKIAEEYLNGSLSIEKIHHGSSGLVSTTQYNIPSHTTYLHKDKDGNLWDVTNLVENYGTPDVMAKTIKDYHDNKSESLQKYIESNKSKYGNLKVDDFIFSKGITYKNNSDDITDPASNIVKDVVEANTANGLKPLNYDELTKNVSSDAMDGALKLLFNNPQTLQSSLTNSTITYSGKNKDMGVARFDIDAEQYRKTIDATFFSGKSEAEKTQMVNALKAIADNGVEFDLPRDIFNKYARDNYVSSIVSEAMLKKGIKSSQWEEDNLHYNYTIQKGTSGNVVVTMNTQTYDPVTKQFTWNDPVNKVYTTSPNLESIMEMIQFSGKPTTDNINQYLYAQALKKENDPGKQQANESYDAYKIRYAKEHNLNPQ